MGLKQETYSSLILLLIVMGVTFGNGQTSSICDNGACDCSPRYRDVTTIECKCNAVRKGFSFTDADFGWKFRKVREFYVSDCDEPIIFTTNAFKDLGQLESLHVEKVGKVEFQSGVFQKLVNLSLQNIRELDFGERAFMGAHDLENIKIRGATVHQLRSHALFDIKGLHSLDISDVVVHLIEKDAVNVDLRHPDSQVFIKNSTINNVESNGIVLTANNFSVDKSALDKISPNAIKISSDLILISESAFGNSLPNNGINMMAHTINIRNNIFKFLPTGVMEITKLGNDTKLIFTNNTVHNIQIEGPLNRISSIMETAEIRDNHFPCTCILGVLHRSLPNYSRNNFCATRCNISFNDFGELVEAEKVCISNNRDPDEAELCRSVTYPTPRSPREGRMPSYFSKSPSSTMATVQPRNSSGRIQVVPVLLFLTLFTVLFETISKINCKRVLTM